MTGGARRLLWFVSGLVVMLGGLEWLVRSNAPLFASATHRALAKVAMYERHPRVDVLFLGTSRTQDGVSPDLVTRALAEVAPNLGAVPGYNAAFTGSSLDALLTLVPRFGFRRDLKTVVIELSMPQLSNEPSPWEEPKADTLTMEDKLGQAAQCVAFIRYRKAFLSDNIIRLPALLVFAPSLGGWETRTAEQVASWLGHKETAATNFDQSLWKPAIIGVDATARKLNANYESIVAKLAALALQLQGHGLKVVFTVPPMSRELVDAPERERMLPLFAEVARRSKCEVWNFVPLSLPNRLFRDPSHLSTEGRAHYSKALALQLARTLGGNTTR
jgi:hypothetical protein